MKTQPGKTILILSVCMAFQMTSFVIILPLFALRFNDLGAGVKALGISEMAYALTSTLAAPLMGSLADRYGRRPLVLVSLMAYMLAFCGYLLAQSAEAFIIIRGLAGVFTAGLIPAVTGLASDLAPKDRQAQWIGFMNAGAAFGWVAGPIAGGLIYDRWGYSAALIVSIGMAFTTLLVALFGVHDHHVSPIRSMMDKKQVITHQSKEAAGSRTVNAWSFLRRLRGTLPQSLSTFLVLLLIFFTVLFAWAFTEPRFMFYAYNDLRWSSSMVGLVISTYGAAMAVGELAFGRLSDRLGRKPVILLGLALFSAQFIGLAFFRNYLFIAATFVIAGLGNALYDPALSAAFLDISPEEHRARVLGVKSMVGSFGSILGPALIAMLSESINPRFIFLTSLGAVLLMLFTSLAYPARELGAGRITAVSGSLSGSGSPSS